MFACCLFVYLVKAMLELLRAVAVGIEGNEFFRMRVYPVGAGTRNVEGETTLLLLHICCTACRPDELFIWFAG